MKFMPHDYQKYAIEYIKSHPITALFLDMGLGKTVTTLTAIRDLMYDAFEVKRVLVIAPLRVARDTWPDELRKWNHLKELTCSVVVGTVAERRRALQQDADIYIVNRENLAWLYENSRLDFDMVVLDELSSFKNHQSKRFRAMKALRPKVKRIVGLTGTPSGNGLMDLWAEFRILDMGERLGRYISQYRNLYFQPDKRNGMVVYSYKPLPGAEEAIYHQIADITVSMKATDYLEMPELVSVAKEVCLSETEKKRYDKLKKSLVLELPGGEVTSANAASLTLKLSQMANGAIYTDGADGSQGTEGAAGFRRLECGKDSCGPHPSGLCRTRPEPAAGRFHLDLVWPDLESGAVPADQRPALAAGAGGRDGHHTAHRSQGHD